MTDSRERHALCYNSVTAQAKVAYCQFHANKKGKKTQAKGHTTDCRYLRCCYTGVCDGLGATALTPGNRENSSVADKHADADRYVNDESIARQLVVGRYENTPAAVVVDEPEPERHRDDDSSRPGGRDGHLHAPVGEFGLVVERINNGDVAFHRYDYQVIATGVGGHLDERREGRHFDVVAARVAEHVNHEHERRIPQYHHGGEDVGHQHAGQHEVGLGPESGRQPDRRQRKPVADQVEHVQSE